ncbi:OsmC family protein [Luteipulveratus halotolerans]|uniref:Osmotically inducible protein OsmC n=1 Tax=Luteipulveratus halotolerans TaxID=1631356 RepID=A0A0L6CLA4_9MICO|nr:OsmC family protein [Luteipulveratus halotolerans]KNX38576.1 osmotically inducible protein OsmC [Luteipulveratus halotolerans]
MSDADHSYATRLAWRGSTGLGYDAYERAHDVTAAPAEQTLRLASDPAFLGDPALLNPEQLVVAAASSCQLLSFLAVAARARLDVVDYVDDATASMSEAHRPMRLDEIVLRPVITLSDTARARPADTRLEHLVEVAHRECFIANSLSTPVTVEPTFTWS